MGLLGRRIWDGALELGRGSRPAAASPTGDGAGPLLIEARRRQIEQLDAADAEGQRGTCLVRPRLVPAAGTEQELDADESGEELAGST